MPNNLHSRVVTEGMQRAPNRSMLRAVGFLSRGDLPERRIHAGPELATPSAQCEGERAYRYCLVPLDTRTGLADAERAIREWLSPPLVLVCVDRSSLTFPCIQASGRFAASILSAEQHQASLRFAERREGKFDGIPHRVGAAGMPILEGSLAHFDCEVEAEYPGGDHVILVARVTDAAAGGGLPLVFFRGGYTTIAEPVVDEEPG